MNFFENSILFYNIMVFGIPYYLDWVSLFVTVYAISGYYFRAQRIRGPMSRYEEYKDVDLSGKVVVITGASSGMGKECVRVLAKHNCTIVLGCRNRTKTENVIAGIEE